VAVARQSPAAGELLGDKEPPAPRERLGSRVREARDRVWELVEERPLTAGAVGLALGLLGGLVLPGSRRENELLGGPRDHLLDEARQRVRKTVARGKRVARTAVAVAKEDVEET
jgi:ElaB/YqjD/DUF883 family membrane-anchored ribosome-binding protein